MVDIKQSETFSKWLDRLKDTVARARILDRIERVKEGNFGDIKAIDSTISELRFTFGPGYRIYLTKDGTTVVILLCGGDKSTQKGDIEKARQIADEYWSKK